MNKTYISIFDCKEIEIVIKHSKFIGNMSYTKTKDEAVSYIEKISNKYKDATHNVCAYNLFSGGFSYYTDDREPQGTAGKPILDILKKEEIFDVCVVVSRYFGGVLLGTGGLVLAYSKSCKKLIEQATLAVCCFCVELRVCFEYRFFKKIDCAFLKEPIKILERNFSSLVELKILVEKVSIKRIISCLKNTTCGTVKIEIGKEGWQRLSKK